MLTASLASQYKRDPATFKKERMMQNKSITDKDIADPENKPASLKDGAILFVKIILISLVMLISNKIFAEDTELASALASAFGGIFGAMGFVIRRQLDHEQMITSMKDVSRQGLDYMLGKMLLAILSGFTVSVLFYTGHSFLKQWAFGFLCGYSTQMLDIIVRKLERALGR